MLINSQSVRTSAYNTSKSAILQLARSLAAEWGNPSPSTTSPAPPIRVNSLSPGYIHTALSEESMNHPETREVWLSGSMLGRFSWAEEYRGPVLFLLGEASSFMTGADLRVDGGHCAW
jgi:NAD(P)-dependent dehydrogenase (short-subunit alcohol dehydrogenase family)